MQSPASECVKLASEHRKGRDGTDNGRSEGTSDIHGKSAAVSWKPPTDRLLQNNLRVRIGARGPRVIESVRKTEILPEQMSRLDEVRTCSSVRS